VIRINLLPPEYLARSRRQKLIVLGAAAYASVVGLMLVFFFSRQGHYLSLEKDRARLDAELTQLQVVVNRLKQIEAARAEIQNRINVIENLDQKRLIFPIMFDDFLSQVPSGIWITTFQTSPQGGGYNLTIDSHANSNYAIANWLSNLEKAAYFKSVVIGAISYSDSGLITTAQFNLTCHYEHPWKPAGK